MKNLNAKVTWLENYKLEGTTHSGKTVLMDSGDNASAASPAELVLQALAGCTMMDMYLMITKARKTIKRFWVDVEAKEADDFPKVYTDIHLTYNLEGDGLDKNIIERSIKLSEEKYCRVHAMLHKSVNITSSYNLL